MIVDRAADLNAWVPGIKHTLDQQVAVFGYVNNHYSGHARPIVDTLQELLSAEA